MLIPYFCARSSGVAKGSFTDSPMAPVWAAPAMVRVEPLILHRFSS
jgi:hypothetical protein